MDVRAFAGVMSAKFYDQLNEPFKEWLSGLESGEDREEKIRQWKVKLQKLVQQAVNDAVQESSPRDIKGIVTDKGTLNIFTAKNHLMYNVRLHLNLKKGDEN